MNRSRNFMILVVFSMASLGFQNSFAIPSLEITTSKQVYEYGDILSLSFHVSELSGNQITLHIVDSSGKTSAPIIISIDKLDSKITSPFPFYKTTFPPGTYQVDAEYAGSKASVSFNLVDSGRIAIPTEFKTLVKTWQGGSPSDKDYAGLVRELINNGIINVPNYKNQSNQIHIPHWFKNTAIWWSADSISDNEFGLGIQYLIQKGIILV